MKINEKYLSSLQDDFLKLSFEDKRKKLLLLLTEIKILDEQFPTLSLFIKRVKKTDEIDKIFIGIYVEIINLGNDVLIYNKGKISENFIKIQRHVNSLRGLEEKEIIGENPDKLLENI